MFFFVVKSQFLTLESLVGGLDEFLFSPIAGMMNQSDELIFFRGMSIPSISMNYIIMGNMIMIFCLGFRGYPIFSLFSSLLLLYLGETPSISQLF